MENLDIFRDIAERTGGDIYLGVVGPVRTGKSTLIKKFMELMVIPNIKNLHEKERARDELPQSGAGRTIMTTEPKFIPNEAVEVNLNSSIKMKVRVVDCVGYTVEGALGYEEEEGPRMVMTPWFENEIPFQEAAEIGTRKVIADHSTIGLVVLTDGSITDIPRSNYLDAEMRVIEELKDLNKPFIVILNSTRPRAEETIEFAKELEMEHDVPVLTFDIAEMNAEDVATILEQVLYEFPVSEINVNLPRWIEELEPNHWLRDKFENAVRETVETVKRLRDVEGAIEALGTFEFIDSVSLNSMEMGSGVASVDLAASEELFYQVIEEMTGYRIEGEHQLMKLMKELSFAKKEFDKVADAVSGVRATGYGVVMPRIEEMNLQEPELIRQGNRFGVKLKASAPSLHIVKADITTEITPIIGTEQQCEELVKYMLEEFEESPTKIWESEIFGKSLHDLVREGIQNKLARMPENAQIKLQDTLTRIVNDGSGGLICIII